MFWLGGLRLQFWDMVLACSTPMLVVLVAILISKCSGRGGRVELMKSTNIAISYLS